MSLAEACPHCGKSGIARGHEMVCVDCRVRWSRQPTDDAMEAGSSPSPESDHMAPASEAALVLHQLYRLRAEMDELERRVMSLLSNSEGNVRSREDEP